MVCEYHSPTWMECTISKERCSSPNRLDCPLRLLKKKVEELNQKLDSQIVLDALELQKKEVEISELKKKLKVADDLNSVYRSLNIEKTSLEIQNNELKNQIKKIQSKYNELIDMLNQVNLHLGSQDEEEE